MVDIEMRNRTETWTQPYVSSENKQSYTPQHKVEDDYMGLRVTLRVY